MNSLKRAAVFLMVCLVTWGLLSPVRSALVAQQQGRKVPGKWNPTAKSSVLRPQARPAPQQAPGGGDGGSTATTLTAGNPNDPPAQGGVPPEAVSNTNTISAIGTNGTLTVAANVTANEIRGGYTYVWAVQITDPNGNTLGTEYYDAQAVVLAAGQTASVPLNVSYPDPGNGSTVNARLFRYDATNANDTATVHAGISDNSEPFTASSLKNMVTPFQEP